jgi:tetratricopeptide (TPR) repeat protein
MTMYYVRGKKRKEMKKSLILLLAILILYGCDGQLSKRKIEQYKTEGIQQLQDGNYQEAIDSLTLIIDYDDEDNAVKLALVDANRGLGNQAEVIRLLEEIRSDSDVDDSIILALSDAYAITQNYDKSIELLESIVTDENEELKFKIVLYQGSDYLKDFATVDWETLKDKKWSQVLTFNDVAKYIKFKEGKKYGILDLSYNVVLKAKYADLFTGYGAPTFNYKLGYKTEKNAKRDKWSKIIVFNDKMKISNKQPPYQDYVPEAYGYYIDTKNANRLRYIEWKENKDTSMKAIVKKVSSIKKDMVVEGAYHCTKESCDSEYQRVYTYFLVKKEGLKTIKIQGKPEGYRFGDDVNKTIIDNMIRTKKKKKCGYYNLDGQLVSNFKYDVIKGLSKYSGYCSPYSEGYVVVKKSKKFGMLNQSGELVVDAVFDGLSNLQDGRFLVVYDGHVGIATIK